MQSEVCAYLGHELRHPRDGLLARGLVGRPHAQQRAHAHVVQAVARIVVPTLLDGPLGEFLEREKPRSMRTSNTRFRSSSCCFEASTSSSCIRCCSKFFARSLSRANESAKPRSRSAAASAAVAAADSESDSIGNSYSARKAATLLLQLLDFGGQALNVRVVLLLVLRSKPDHTPTDTLNSTRTLTSSSESS